MSLNFSIRASVEWDGGRKKNRQDERVIFIQMSSVTRRFLINN